ncbi:putative membrane protein DUF2142 [Nonomuraea polychroma]|uniref:Putative membrane protein DUF2142 n=2 Tax=Nonomuraea polychroma TaxID=46176 RepID=A0A438MFG3_9ACTN|nr:putative membrane protein DUF2142 [Nonomuraea polychroma]
MGGWPINAILWAIIAISPALAVTFLVWHYFDRSLLAYVPVWTDEVDYWHQVATFRAVGFAGGAYGVNEAEAKLAFLRFGSHGPAFPMLLAGISAIAGWRPFSVPLINLAVMGAAIFGYLALIRVGWVRAALTGALVLTFWPVMLYLATTMPETIHQGMAIVLAGLFFLLIRRGPTASRTPFIASVVVLTLACLLRPTWALLFVPLFFLRGATLTGRQLVRAALKGGFIVVAASGLFSLVSTPYPKLYSELIELTLNSPLTGVKLLLQNFWLNVQRLAESDWLELGLWAALLAIVAAAVVRVVRHLRQGTIDHDENCAAGAFHLLNLLPVTVLVIGMYDTVDSCDYRFLAPHVLLSALLALARSEHAIVIIALAANLALAGAFRAGFLELHQQHFLPATDPKTTALGRYIEYKPHASVWENTILFDFTNFVPGLVNVPAGVGLNLYAGLDHPIRSRYLLITKQAARSLGEDRLRLLTTTAKGNLYLRED